MKKIIEKKLSEKILTLGVSKSTYGGMSSVLISYERCFDKMRFIPTWKLGHKSVKIGYAFQAILRCLLLLVFDRRIKILHIHGSANASFYRKAIFIKIGKFFQKKIVFHQHAADFEDFFNKSINKQEIINIINSCDVFIVLSQSWKTYFLKIGVNEQKIYILNNIVFPPEQMLVRSHDEKLHLLFLGELSYRKGIYDLLEVLKTNKEYFNERLELRIGGNLVDGDINKYIIDNNLTSFIRYEGWVSGTKKVDCLEWADIYILPSYNEGLPIAILEAMSYSHPVISTDVGGIPEILHSYDNGILINVGNLDQINQAILFFIENPKCVYQYGKNAYLSVKSFFPDRVMADLKSIYNKLLSI